MSVNGKAKGSGFERKIANLFSARFENVTGIKQSFRRNPDSGSFFGGTNKKRTETHDLDHAFFGDLICPEKFNFSVECKSYKSGPTFASIVKGKITQWDDWIKQASQDAESSKKAMMLIMKYNGVDELCVLLEEMPAPIIIKYKQYFVYKLSDLLLLDSSLFFS